MNKRFTLALIVIGLCLFIVSTNIVFAGGGRVGNFIATRCITDYAMERTSYDSLFGVSRNKYLYQYSEWNIMSDNRLVNGFFIDWNTKGDKASSGSETPGGGVYKGQFYLIPDAATGVWIGEWVLVFKRDGNKVFTAEGKGNGGELEGLKIKIYYEAEPGSAPRCAAGGTEDFNGKILRAWRN